MDLVWLAASTVWLQPTVRLQLYRMLSEKWSCECTNKIWGIFNGYDKPKNCCSAPCNSNNCDAMGVILRNVFLQISWWRLLLARKIAWCSEYDICFYFSFGSDSRVEQRFHYKLKIVLYQEAWPRHLRVYHCLQQNWKYDWCCKSFQALWSQVLFNRVL